MLIGVDGTGSRSQRTYDREMGSSYVNTMVASYPRSNRLYLRGPTLLGNEIGVEAQTVSEQVLEFLATGAREIILAGYSRGGAAVNAAAQLLEGDSRFTELWKRAEPKRYTPRQYVPRARACLVPDDVAVAFQIDSTAHLGGHEWASHDSVDRL